MVSDRKIAEYGNELDHVRQLRLKTRLFQLIRWSIRCGRPNLKHHISIRPMMENNHQVHKDQLVLGSSN